MYLGMLKALEDKNLTPNEVWSILIQMVVTSESIEAFWLGLPSERQALVQHAIVKAFSNRKFDLDVVQKKTDIPLTVLLFITRQLMVADTETRGF